MSKKKDVFITCPYCKVDNLPEATECEMCGKPIGPGAPHNLFVDSKIVDKVPPLLKIELRKPRKRPSIVPGSTERITTGCGNLYVTVNFDKIGLVEIFAVLGKPGSCGTAQMQMAGRLVSIAARCDIDPSILVDHLAQIRCMNSVWSDGKQVLSCADAISIILKKRLIERGMYTGKIPSEEKHVDNSEPKRKSSGQEQTH